jgi:hypothetical protein
MEKKTLQPTMYNRNYGGFDYVRIHSELLTYVLNAHTAFSRTVRLNKIKIKYVKQ